MKKSMKRRYEEAAMEMLSLEPESPMLSGSIINSSARIIIPNGQQVDEYDFSSPTYSQEWDVTKIN